MSEELEALANRLQRRVDKLLERRIKIIKGRTWKRGSFNNHELDAIQNATMVLNTIIQALRVEDP